MNLETVRAGLAERVKRVQPRTYDTVDDAMTGDCAAISIGAGEFDDTFDDGLTATWTVFLMFSLGGGAASPQRKLDQYLNPSGDKSIRQAVQTAEDGDILDGEGVSVRVTGWNDPGPYTSGGTDFVGVEVSVEVVG